MSTSSRILSGSLASWVKIGITFVARLVLVPVYLTYWDAGMYGVWIAIEAFIALITIINKGHQDFLGYEFLKLGKPNRNIIALYVWSGCWAGLVLGLLEFLIIIGVVFSGSIELILGSSIQSDLSQDIAIILLLEGGVWLISGCTIGYLHRSLHPFGYYPRMSWWAVLGSVLTTFAPVVGIIFGADLLLAGIILVISKVVYNIPRYFDIYLIMKKEKIWDASSSFKVGYKHLYNSMALLGNDILGSLRQQGVRVILTPLAGASGVAAFSTMRTGANIVLQGLGTITNPLLPELMRFLNKKDQERTEVAFGTIWFVMIVFAPLVVLLQLFIEPLFLIWTRGAISFNPLLFALLSLGVLVYGLAQPATSVVRGNNLLKSQLIITAIAALVVVGTMTLVVPLVGILGAAIALLIAELFSLVGYVYVANKWFETKHMKWPAQPFKIASTSIIISGSVMIIIVLFPELKWIAALISLLMLGWNAKLYWESLPVFAIEHAKIMINRVPFIGQKV